MDYKELLKDGRWQKKRSEIMMRDGFKCRCCNISADTGATLNVHHLRYRQGALPWEYENDELVTLCEMCHKMEHNRVKEKIYNIKIGDTICYDHSDYTNYGFIYSIDFFSMAIGIVTLDDGGDYSCMYIDKARLNTDGTIIVSRRTPVVRMRNVEFDRCNMWGYAAENLSQVVRNNELKNYGYYYEGYAAVDIPEELEILANNYSSMLANNHDLREYIDNL